MTQQMDLETQYITLKGSDLLKQTSLNKGTAFSLDERSQFELNGLLPAVVETLEQQIERAYLQFKSVTNPLQQHLFLRDLQDSHEILFYALINQYLPEMMPIIYTPTVGEACEHYSEIYRHTRGLFISYPQREHIKALLKPFAKQDIQVIVVTDGSRILGLGDLGAGGMGIPIGKLALYSACGGIDPSKTLAITLDVGTNNDALLSNPHYIGWRQNRINTTEYDDFLAAFISAVKDYWPNVLLQFEDFEQNKALPLLEKYREELCCFNDDIQGTAAVTVGTLLAACQKLNTSLRDHTFAFAGAGSAGCGIAIQLINQLSKEGLTFDEARQRIFIFDRNGLITSDIPELKTVQQHLAQNKHTLPAPLNQQTNISLFDIIQTLQPSVLIGVSGQAGLFTEPMIRLMASQHTHPIILPLSNPSKQTEALPQQLIEWTQGRAIIATGSPFQPASFADKTFPIAQCNNSYIFPGLGLAVIATNIRRITDDMLMAASQAFAGACPKYTDNQAPLLPALNDSAQISQLIAQAVAETAVKQNLAPQRNAVEIAVLIHQHFWRPCYRPYAVAKKAG